MCAFETSGRSMLLIRMCDKKDVLAKFCGKEICPKKWFAKAFLES